MKFAILYIMSPKFIAIAGGTGSGKSTLAYALADKYPNKIGILHLDDYHWQGEDRKQTPRHEGMRNWDHPDAIDWKSLIADMQKLKRGETIQIMSKNERLIPREPKESNEMPTPRLQLTIGPKPVIILEGYLSLYNQDVRKFLDFSFFLDASHDTRIKRRTNFLNSEYEQNVLIPMHEEFVEPTKQFADEVIDVSNLTPEEVLRRVSLLLFDSG